MAVQTLNDGDDVKATRTYKIGVQMGTVSGLVIRSTEVYLTNLFLG